jgi:PAS domain S-box-containing protein
VVAQQPTLLYVDDDEVILRAYSWVFERAGFTVQTATTGADALRLAAGRPDLIVLDVRLPDIDGYEVCRRLKADPATASIPVLHLSAAFVTSADRAHGLEGGADGYLVKPVEPREVLATVRALLRVKEAEAAVREAARHWQTTFDATADAVCLLDRDGRVLRGNQAMTALLGRPCGAAVGQPCRDLLPGGPGAAAEALRAQAQEARGRGAQDVPSAGRWFRLTVDPVLDDRGAVTGTVHTWRDITDRRQAEEALRASEERYRIVAEAATDAILLIDDDSRLLLVNRAAERIFGYGAAELTGRELTLLMPERLRPAHRAALARYLRTGRRSLDWEAVEFPGLHSSGRELALQVSLGECVGGGRRVFIGVVRDVTERHRTEEARQRAEAKYRSIFENVSEGVFQTVPAGGFLTANPALARILGYASPEELVDEVRDVGRQLHVDPNRRREFARLVEERGSVRGFECQLYRKDGGRIWVALTANAVRDAGGRLLHYDGILEDITERKRAEEALQFRVRQQAAVAELGRRALGDRDLAGLLDEAAAVVAQTLAVEYTRVLERLPDAGALLLRAGVGWAAGAVGQATQPGGGGSMTDYTLLSGGPLVVEDLREERRFAIPELLRAHGIVSSLSVPIPGPHGPSGILSAETCRRRTFTRDDAHFLEAVAHVLGAAGERRAAEEVRLATEAEFRAARRIQQKLFPAAAPRLAGLDIAGARHGLEVGGASFPAEATGGDYYDYIPMADGALGVVVGDVSGHGFGPALLMAAARAYLRALAWTHTDVGQILSLANHILAEDIEEGRFITLVFVRLEPRTRSLVYASAGHLTGYVLDREGRVRHTLGSTGPPLGVYPDGDFPCSGRLPLEDGTLVLLFTDGLVESHDPDGNPFGAQRVLSTVRHYRGDSAQRMVHNLYHTARAFSQNSPQIDDITVTVIRVQSGG